MPAVAELLQTVRRGLPSETEPAARALKHLARQSPAGFARHHRAILHAACTTQDLRTRWNLIVVLGLLPLGGNTRAAAIDWLFERLADQSPFTRTFAIQALVDLSAQDPPLEQRLRPVLERFAATGTAGMQARARKLLQQLARQDRLTQSSGRVPPRRHGPARP